MRAQQRGITLIGWLFLLTPFAIVFYAGVRLAPVYLNYLKVAHLLDAIKSEYTGQSATLGNLSVSLGRELDVQSVDYPTAKEITIQRQGKGWVMDASYDDQAPLFANISIQVAFHKTVQIGDTGAGE
jgi:hypothetical protein